MDVRSELAMVFHLDKCLGCHTCSIACKNLWTDRRGAEYMWWNNVETKPGSGYPTRWEDQDTYQGGWRRTNTHLELRSTSKASVAVNMFHHPHMPTLDDYYEPWTYQYDHLFTAPPSEDQPTAQAVSLITGKKMTPQAGPNWDDDLGGSPVYAANDPNLAALDPEQRRDLFAIERMVFFYVPRTCNHCLNPSCVAACPSGAIYKRGEDGIVLIDQERCRGWRSCVAACPYKKTYFNWAAGKSEKCIHCFPRLETGQPPACFHSCPGRIRYLGVLLYDADRIHEAASASPDRLIDAQRSLILDPFDPVVAAEAGKSGVPVSTMEAARRSPVFKFVKEWRIALPLHAEFRTLPMLFYVPPLTPAIAGDGVGTDGIFHQPDRARVTTTYLASLFSAGDEASVRYALAKELAVRSYRRSITVGDIDQATTDRLLAQAHCTRAQAEEIYRLTSLATANERFVIPPGNREEAVETLQDPFEHKQSAGFGFLSGLKGTRS
jgi:nitrate reductase beta subunit